MVANRGETGGTGKTSETSRRAGAFMAPRMSLRAAKVEPSAEQLAEWAEFDARYGETDTRWGVCEVRPGQDGDFDLVERVAECERVISWAKADQLAAVYALAARPSMNPFWPVQVREPNIAGEEIAARLGTSRVAGRTVVAAAKLLAEQLYPTADALHDGEIDWIKAQILIAGLKDVPGEVAVMVQELVLPGAGRRTPGQLRHDIQRALAAVDPEDAELRGQRAVQRRRVCRPKTLPDGMAGIWAVLPAHVAAAIDAALKGKAHVRSRAGDPRTIDQLRADTFADSLLAETPLPAALMPAALMPAPNALALDPVPDALALDPPAPEPNVLAPDAVAPGAVAPDAPHPGPDDSTAGGQVLAGGGAGQGIVVRIDVTVGLTTLLGLDKRPGELAGYGAITAQTARRLAMAGTWRRLVTDPRSGTVLDVGKHRYHPPNDLAEIVRARDRHCLSLVCGADARTCELDHREPFHQDGTGGSTSEANLGSLCKRDHLLKTHAGWDLDKDDAGTTIWTTPTGHRYTYRPDPPPSGEAPPSRWDEPPPF